MTLPKASKPRLVVIGNGMAPGRALERLFEAAPGAYDVTIFNAEPRVNYDRIMLSPMLAGEKCFDDIIIHGDAWYLRHGATLHKGVKVTAIDRAARSVTTQHGQVAAYDKLIIATGSVPVVLDIPGNRLPGVLTYRDLDDVKAMILAAQSRGRAVVIGGGLLGLEAAAGLAERGMDVTVVHLMPTLMERQLDAAAGALLAEALVARGIRVITGVTTAAITGTTRVAGVTLADGRQLDANLVVMAVGIRPNAGIARDAGLVVNRGIVVDPSLRTSDPDIFALGECAECAGQVFGLVAPLYEMANVVASHLAGDRSPTFVPAALATRLKVTGINLFSGGDFAPGDGRDEIVLEDPAGPTYKRLVIKNGRVLGAVMYGDTEHSSYVFDLIRSARNVDAIRETLLFGALPDAIGNDTAAAPTAALTVAIAA